MQTKKTLLNDVAFWQTLYATKRPYVLRGENVELFNLDEVQKVLQTVELLKKDIYIVENENDTYIRDYPVGHLNSEASWVEKNADINEAFRKRYVVKVQQLERWDRQVSHLCRSLEEKVNGYVDAHLYLAPANGGSFGLHTDPHDVFVVMLRGKKRFELPEFNLTIDLAPGDWLYIPKDAQHKGFSITNSVMLSLGVRSYLSETLRAPLSYTWYPSLMISPSEQWYRDAAESEEGHDISAGPV